MNIRILIQFILIIWMWKTPLAAQTTSFTQADAPQTLQWVARQSGRLDSILHDAMRGNQPLEGLIILTEAYQIFDAIAVAGLYCTDIRSAAEAGRRQCDLINYRLEKDLNSVLQRVVEARRQANFMKESAKTCQSIPVTAATGQVFTPNELILHDTHIAELDLSDGLASENLHILSQKLEHAIRTLYDLEHLAFTLSGCDIPMQLADSAIRHCQDALSAPNWLEINRSVKAALANLQTIRQSATCY
jgi:hypothetical protein